MNDFRDLVLAMSKEKPNMRVSTVVALALAVENAQPPNLNDAQQLAAWAGRQDTISDFLSADERIHAIRELRTLTGASLSQAKDAIDVMRGVS